MKTSFVSYLAISLAIFVSCGKGQPLETPANETFSSFLSYPNVTCMAEDATGHIWIGTSYGLNRSLTYGYHQYYAASDSLSLANNHITTLYTDHDGRMWIASKGGNLCYLTPEGTFRPVAIDYHEKVRISFVELSGGRLFCNDENSIFRFVPEQDRMQLLIDGPQKNLGFFPYGEELSVVYPDHISNYSSADGSLLSEHPLPEICGGAIQAPDGNLWLTTEESSRLRIVRPGSLTPVEVPRTLVEALSGRKIIQLVNGRENGRGLFLNVADDILYYDTENGQVHTLREKGFSLDTQMYDINCVFYDSRDNIWVGTDGGGIQMLQNFHKWNRFQILLDYFKKTPVSEIAFDEKENALSITDHRGNHFRYDLAEKKVTSLPSQSGPSPKRTYPTRTLHLSDGKILSVNDNSNLIVSMAGQDIGYIIPLEKVTEALGARQFHPTTLFQDTLGQIWIGTKSNGLAILNLKDNVVRAVSGIQGKDVSTILEDRENHIWVATKNGLYEYGLDGALMNSFSRSGHEGENAYMDNSCCVLPDGILLLGTMRGIVIMNPAQEQALQPERFFLEDLRVHNSIVRPGKNAPIDKAMVFSPAIRLRHDQNSFGISFTELNYWKPYEGSYSYRLEGFDKYWINCGNRHEAFYSNVPPGKYTFQARVSDLGGEFSSASCEITILPAPWASWPAKLAYVLAALGLLTLAAISFLRHVRNKETLRRIGFEKQQEQQMNDIIKKYFANVAHQLRTPLTMIYGPIDTLSGSRAFSGKERDLLRILRYNADRMLGLVNQIMSFHSLESDALSLQVCKCDLVTPLAKAMALYKINAEKKRISFLTNGFADNLFVYADMEKVLAILDNLLSNALKFTPEGGFVSVSLSCDGTDARIDVSNSGSFIPENQQESIFRRFYQLDGSSSGKDVQGSGVGLYYARKLAMLHHGTLTCRNLEGEEGVCFSLCIPVSKEAFSQEEFKEVNPASFIRNEPLVAEDPVVQGGEEGPSEGAKPQVLVIDDDVEITSYLKTLLEPAFRVCCCFDAESALRVLEKDAPDLIISDVMMTGMSGLEFCGQVKGDLQYCHIPFILLTAKDGLQDQIEGLNRGADAYVVKPFHADYLISLAGNLIKSRERLRKVLSDTAGETLLGEDALAPQDRSFLDQVYSFWDEQLSNPEFNIAAVVDKMHISHTKFIYKVKGLTGFTPSELFKNYKLNKAAAMIREGKYNVSEVADLTGFGTLAHFSRAFKKKFGVPPSEYKG